jgi:hypothetical protein
MMVDGGSGGTSWTWRTGNRTVWRPFAFLPTICNHIDPVAIFVDTMQPTVSLSSEFAGLIGAGTRNGKKSRGRVSVLATSRCVVITVSPEPLEIHKALLTP